MWYRKHFRLALCSGILLWLGRTVVMGQNVIVDQNRMNRDIRIMEGVLSKLLRSQSTESTSRTARVGDRSIVLVRPDFSFGQSPKGVYLPNFGILFKLESGHGTFLVADGTYNQIIKQRKDLEKEMLKSRLKLKELQNEMADQRRSITGEEKKEDNEEKEAAEPVLPEIVEGETFETTEFEPPELDSDIEKQEGEAREKTMASIKSTLILFFSNYASAIGQLVPTDRLAVLVDYPRSSWTDGSNPYLIASVLYRDISDFRKKAITQSEFLKRIRFQDQPEDRDIFTDIDVMTEIIDRAAQSSDKIYGMSNSGVYIEGLGALFFISTPATAFWGSGNARVMAGTGYDKAFSYYVDTDPKKARENQEAQRKSHAERFQKFQDNVFDWVSSYGHTLRLKPDEWVIMDVDMGAYTFQWDTESGQPSRFLFQVRKTDLDQYQQGTLPLTTLRSRSMIRTF